MPRKNPALHAIPSPELVGEPMSGVRISTRGGISPEEQEAIIDAMIQDELNAYSSILTSEQKEDFERVLRAEFLEFVDQPALRAIYEKLGWSVPEI